MKSESRGVVQSELGEYAALVAQLKVRIRFAQVHATRSVNRELIKLYWDIGRAIVERQKRLGWGKSVVVKLAADLRTEFPEQKGFSPQNLWFMRMLYEEFHQHPKLLRLVRELPWGLNITILTKVKDNKEREYYLRAAIAYGWSRAVLTHHIETKLYRREVKAKKTHNFRRLLPARKARAVNGVLKDPYVFDFIALEPDAKERELERELLRQKDDDPSVGILLCKDKDDVVVQFALRDVHKPLGVARYQVTEKLPKQLAEAFPSVAELKRQLKEVKQ